MAQTITGKCTFTNDSATVQGNAEVGWNSLNFPDPTSRKVTIKPRATNAVYQVAAVNYATRQCTLTAPYAGATVTDGDYEVSWDFTSRGYRRIGLNDQDFAVYVTEAIDQINEDVEAFVVPSVGPPGAQGERGLPGDASVYNAAATYALDDQVFYGESIYYSLQNNNTGNTPDASPTFWQRVILGTNVDEYLKNGTFVNVLDPKYGAVGDGVTDDTAAIQAAIDDAAVLATNDSRKSVAVVFPAKRYLVTSTLTNEYAMPLIGQFGYRLCNDDSGIVTNSDITVLDYATTHPSNDQDIILFGMHIQNTHSAPTNPLVKTFTNVANGLDKGQTNDGFIMNCWLYGGKTVLELERMQGYQIINNVIHGNGTNTDYGIKAMGLKNSVIVGNRIFQVAKGSSGSAPLLLTGSAITGEATMPSSMVTVVGNHIDANVDDACILVQNAEGVNIHDNNLRSGKYGVRVDGTSGAKTISIKNNQLSNHTHEYIIVDNVSNLQINGNTFQNMIVGSTGSVVETDTYYVSVIGTSTNVQVIGNNFNSVNPAAYSAGTTYKIWEIVLSDGIVYHSLQDNNIGNTPASSPGDWTSRGVVKTKGISLGASVSNSFYGQNLFSTIVSTPVTDSGSGNTNYDATGGSGTPEGNDRTIQFNNSGAFAGSDALTFDTNERMILKRNLASGLGAGWLYQAAIDTAPFPDKTPATLSQRWSRGTIASPRRAKSGDMFAALDWRTYAAADDGSSATVTNPLVLMYAKATVDHTSTDTSHSLIINLNPNNSGTAGDSANNVMTLSSDGNVTLNKSGALLTTPSLKIGAFSTVSALDFGTYTPTFSNPTNTDSTPVASGTAQFLRVGNTVTVSGAVTVDPTGAGSVTVEITLPVASTFTANTDCVGTIATGGIATDHGIVRGNVSGSATKAFIAFSNSDTASRLMFYHFTYVVK